MKRKILYIILGTILILILTLVLWFWFFGNKGTTTETPGDLFGTGDPRSGTGTGGSGTGGNNQAPIGGNTGTGVSGGGTGGGGNVQTPIGGGGQGGVGTVSAPPNLTYINPNGTTLTLPGAIWLDGSGGAGGSGGGAGALFRPTPINQVSNISISGTPYILQGGGEGNGGLSFTQALLGAGLAGALSCSAFLVGGAAAGLNPLSALRVQVSEPAAESETFMGCLARSLARVAIQRITASTVEWINSGFEGKPAFVQDYKGFFTDVADQAAGEFIQGTSLAFLCSPFQLQVRIAIAQSYARRKTQQASSCTLTQVVNNVESFLAGNFSEGGWRGLLSFTTTPSNNPFGAYMRGWVGLVTAEGQAITLAEAELSNNDGFLSSKECTTGANGVEECEIVTPGKTIEKALEDALGAPLQSLQLADSFDEIINALMQQLINKVLNSGLTNLSKSGGYSSNLDTQAIAEAQKLVTDLQATVAAAQQYGSVKQGSIRDIQTAQAQLINLQNCFSVVASSSASTPAEVTQAMAGAQSAAQKIAELEVQVAFYNAQITAANEAITKAQEIQSDVLIASSVAEVRSAQSRFTAARTAGTFLDNTHVTSAQQDRVTLQAQMSALNTDTSAKLAQCHALQQ